MERLSLAGEFAPQRNTVHNVTPSGQILAQMRKGDNPSVEFMELNRQCNTSFPAPIFTN